MRLESKLEALLDLHQVSETFFALAVLNINYQIVQKHRKGLNKLSLHAPLIDRVAGIIEELRRKPTTKRPELFFPEMLRPSFNHIAMHSTGAYKFQWSAFTAEPTFDFETGLWLSKEFQINLSNMLEIPYDERGPALALFKKDLKTQDWVRVPQLMTVENLYKDVQVGTYPTRGLEPEPPPLAPTPNIADTEFIRRMKAATEARAK